MEIKIGSKIIGDGRPCYIVAETGLNHNGDINIAKRLIETAAGLGVDAVKFQKRNIDRLLTKESQNEPYVNENSLGRTYGEHRRKLELPDESWYELSELSKDLGLDFFASPWEEESIVFLEKLGVPAYKIASADITNIPFLKCVATKNKPIILSAGMCTFEELDLAVDAILKINQQLALLHCISAYPHEDNLTNLKLINTLKQRYGLLVGYSGHEKSGVVIASAAVALGACIVEKHFTLDHTMRGPDHAASMELDGMRRLTESIRKVESAVGDGNKRILECEIPVRKKLAKSIASKVKIKKGKSIKREDLILKCPGIGLEAKHITDLIGKVSKVDIEEDSLIPLEALEWQKE